MYITKNLSKLIMLSGLIYVCCLITYANDGVFFSGDAGVKYLMAKQMSDGNFNSYIVTNAPEWIKILWMKGMFPIEPPMVYNISGQYYIQYQLYFPFISAIFLHFFGFKGLFILPVIGLLVIWFGYYILCRKNKVDEFSCAISLFAIIYCSPLTLYGAMFWEHTLGIALSFSGILLLLSNRSNKIATCIAGLLMGLSVYLRSELIVLSVVFMISILLFGQRINMKTISRISFAAGVSIALLVMLLLNYIIYDDIAGLHAVQVLKLLSINERLKGYVYLIKPLLILLTQHYPLIIPIVIVGILSLKQKTAQLSNILFITSILYIVVIPFILPNRSLSGYGGKQWGPRFLLGVLPIITFCWSLKSREVWKIKGAVFRWTFGAIVLASFTYGFFINTIVGARELINDYQYRIFPLYQEVVKDNCPIVVVSHQWIAQELAATMQNKFYLLAKNGQDLSEIGKQAIINGHNRILFIASSEVVLNDKIFIPIDGNRYAFMRFIPRGKYSTYVIHDVELGWVTQ
jgi:hypothetical protein